MKRRALILLAALLALNCAAAETASWPGEGTDRRKVVNCDEWVSLRAEPYTSSERVTQVWLGDTVYNCEKHSNVFTACETYAGQRGYILSEYLAEASYRVRMAPETVEGTPIWDDPADFDGGWEVEFAQLGLRVLCARSYDGEYGGELLRASCFDAQGGFIWGLSTESLNVTELTTTDAYAGGTPDHPLLIVHNADLGLAAVDPATGWTVWVVDGAVVDLGASQAHALAGDGTLYVGGYYGPHPVAISADGDVLWRGYAGPDAVWLCGIQVEGSEIVATFDAPDGDGLGTVRFDRFTGQVTSTEPIA